MDTLPASAVSIRRSWNLVSPDYRPSLLSELNDEEMTRALDFAEDHDLCCFVLHKDPDIGSIFGLCMSHNAVAPIRITGYRISERG